MSKPIHFMKMHGIGNDYIFVDTAFHQVPDPQRASIAWSAPHTGIGSDGLVLIGRGETPEADYTMRIFNADGSEGLMCGNACRCIGKYVYERGFTDKTRIGLMTASGLKILNLDVDAGRRLVHSVTVDMGEPLLECPSQFVADAGSVPLPEGVFVSMGNPHYVIFVENLANIDVAATGSLLEHHPCFPERCNIEFAQVTPAGIEMRVWERGSGITMACGTGACATAVAASATGRTGRRSRIMMQGGTLDIEWKKDTGRVYLSGPATIVFEGEIELPEGD